MTAGGTTDWIDELRRAKASQERSSTAEWVAAQLREQIVEGLLLPGSRLSEDAIKSALGVSRNTLREAFRLLAHEKLLEHRLNRGVFVRELDIADVVDLFRVRRLVEGAALREAGTLPTAALARLETAVADGERAARDGRWPDVGTANMRFHQAIAGLMGSHRVDELMRQLLAELRLVFLKMADPRTFHEPYLRRNRQIVDVLVAGDLAEAARMLDVYLADAENQLVHAYPELTS